MKMKQYEAENLRDALAQARAELGPDAIVLSTQDLPPLTKMTGARQRIRITAAVDENPEGLPPANSKSRFGRSYLNNTEDDASQQLDEALGRLERHNQNHGQAHYQAQQQATRIARDPQQNNFRSLIERITIHAPPWRENGPRVVVLVGASGVGKTVTAAKLAAQARHYHGVQTGLICADTQRIAAAEQLGAYANILELPFTALRSTNGIDKALKRLRGCSQIIVDTAGASPRDSEQISQVLSLQRAIQSRASTETLLVLSASQSIDDLIASSRRFSQQGLADALIFTKIDEAERLASIAETAVETSLPISLLSASKQVLGKLVPAQPEYLARLAYQQAA